jgi:bisphosphoglycerate-independent phosphoglycerate mutase (AlkP superfamily)
MTIVNLASTDESGHSGNWNSYLGAIRLADSLVSTLWDVIQSDSLLRDKTTMVVVNDHGRHTTDFSGDGDGCDGCRRIMLLILGPDTPSRKVDPDDHKLIDVAPTVASLLRFKSPYASGTVLTSATQIPK